MCSRSNNEIILSGVGNVVDCCEFQHRAFGHVIYMQKNADKTVVNETENPVILGNLSQGNSITSSGAVDDLGENNTVLKIK